MANKSNIPNEINLPGTLTGRHESSLISPMGFSAFTTQMKSDIAPMSAASFVTRMKSDIAPIPFANFSTAMKSDVAAIATSQFNPNLKSDIAPITLTQPEMKSLFEIQIKSLTGRHESSDTSPVNSLLGSNNELSNISPINSILGANNQASATAPLTSTLTGRFDTSSIVPFISQISGRHESSAIDSSVTTQTGRHDSSGVDDGITTLGGRHESSGVDDGITTQTGRHESSGIDDGVTTQTGRHESSGIDDAITSLDGRHESSGIDDGLTIPDGRFTDSSIDDFWNQDIILPIQQLDLSPYAQIGATNFSDIPNVNTSGFTIKNSVLDSQFKGISGASYTYPNSQGVDFGSVDTTQGVNFLDIPNVDAKGFTTKNSLLDSQYQGISGQNYTYPDSHGLGFGLVDSTQGVNFVDISNLDATGFTTFFDTGTPTQFKGATAGEYTYPDNHGLGYGLISNSLFTNMYPTPYTTPLLPDGFTQNQSIEDSQFSKDSFAGGGKIGLDTEFTHATFGGVQAQVPIMGNNPTGLGEFTSGGNTSGDIGVINAFDDTKSGAKGFTPHMFDIAGPKTQFNGIAGNPGSLEYTYPTDVGPAGVGRLMYDVPFSDAGNPYGGSYISSLSKQIPTNPLITINKNVGTDSVNYNLYNAAPDRLHFNEGNKYETSLGDFAADITINGAHPRSVLANFAAREHSPSPLDSMQVLIPGNTGPTGESDVTANYTFIDGHPNYNTQNLTYKSAQVASQRVGFERNELFARSVDYDNSSLYGHDLTFGGTGDDPSGLKSYKEPHILRDMDSNWGLFGGFDEGAFRGGFLTLGSRALKDVERNAKQIISDPIKGLLWGLKQIGLQASNPKVETEMAFLGRRTRVFNLGVGLLVNMLTGPFGIKLYRHGLLNGLGEGDSTYETAVKAHGGINPYDSDRADNGKASVGKGGGNRLVQLKNELIFKGSDNGSGGFLGLGNLLGYEGQKIDMLSDTAFGGPKSLYGIGGTTIRRYDNSTHHNNGDPGLSENLTLGAGGMQQRLAKYLTLGHDGLATMAEVTSDNPHKAHDFRDELTKLDSDNLSVTDGDQPFPYDTYSREALFGYTKYSPLRDRTFLPADGEEQKFHLEHGVDNYIDFDQDYTDDVDLIDGKRDMIKLIVEDVVTEKKVRMRSYLTDISDAITPEWNKVSYVGRPDQVHNYTGATRQVSFTLKFAALSRDSMVSMYTKVNYLYGLCYPHLANGSTGAVSETMVSPIIKLTMGDWLYKTPGYFDSMTTTIDNSYPWDINLESEAKETAQLPTILSIALTFVVIGDGPHLSAIQSDDDDKLSGIHIGGGVNANTAQGKFFGMLPIQGKE
jgi:hypothetical protein